MTNDNDDPITCQVVPLPDGSLVSGKYYGVIVGRTDPEDDTERPQLVICAIGLVANSGLVPIVHVVAGSTFPPDGTDPDDWFCAEVFYDLDGNLSEVFPRVIYGKGLVDEDGTGWVYEGSNRPIRHADPDTSARPTHAIPIFRDKNAEVDDDGPLYVIEWPAWGNTVTKTEVNPDTGGWTGSCSGSAITITLDFSVVRL